MNDTVSGNTPNLNGAFCKVISWLQLDEPMRDDLTIALRERFELAVRHPGSSYLQVASQTRIVQIFEGMAVCEEVPDDEDLRYRLHLNLTKVSTTFVTGLNEDTKAKIRKHAETSYSNAREEMRMKFGT